MKRINHRAAGQLCHPSHLRLYAEGPGRRGEILLGPHRCGGSYVEKRYALEGGDMVTLWTSGAAGDQNPITFFRHIEPDGMPLPGYGVPDGFGYEIGYRYGEHVAWISSVLTVS